MMELYVCVFIVVRCRSSLPRPQLYPPPNPNPKPQFFHNFIGAPVSKQVSLHGEGGGDLSIMENRKQGDGALGAPKG